MTEGPFGGLLSGTQRALECTHTLHPHPPETRANASDQKLGWLMGLEPTTTGITILDSTN